MRRYQGSNCRGFKFLTLTVLVVLAAAKIFPFVFATATAHAQDAAATTDRPNILWIVSEDNGPFLGCYGDEFAKTPNLDNLAKQGVLYLNAFANAPVCAPARSTLISGLYASSMGTQHMRSSNTIPKLIRFFPEYLRSAGYYCSNRSKTDYNMKPIPKGAWDQIKGGHYKNRKKGQPFFSVFNIGISHESSLHRGKIDPNASKKLKLPPYHPDTTEIRSNWVQYYGIMTRMDQEVGRILKELEKNGLAEETIVFYYADHGGILTRSKRFLYDSGMHVPMIVRFPKKYQHLAAGKPGTKTDRLVSFVDFAPTVLSLAGVNIPKQMQGEAFLGQHKVAPRKYVYGFRGRMDERYDMMRAVRDKKFKYIRNYMPHRIYGQHLDYLWKMPATRSWEKAYKEGKCNASQKIFWETKPAEELYDIAVDPHEVNNLADSPDHRETLLRMRKANREHLIKTHDTGFLPESEMIARASASGSTIYDMVRDASKYPMEQIMQAAELASGRDPKAVPKLIALLKEKDPALRYWGATGCAVLGKEAAKAAEALTKTLKDSTPSVRIAAAEALCKLGRPEQAVPVLEAALSNPTAKVALHAINVLEEVGADAKPAAEAIRNAAKNARDHYVKRAAGWAAKRF